jgi:hypothetical protein
MTRNKTSVEFTLEPVDAHGDIIDPQHYDTFGAAYDDRMRVLATFPEAVAVDMAVVTRVGNDEDGEQSRTYDYRHRTMRDGTIIQLTRDGDPEPTTP